MILTKEKSILSCHRLVSAAAPAPAFDAQGNAISEGRIFVQVDGGDGVYQIGDELVAAAEALADALGAELP